MIKFIASFLFFAFAFIGFAVFIYAGFSLAFPKKNKRSTICKNKSSTPPNSSDTITITINKKDIQPE